MEDLLALRAEVARGLSARRLWGVEVLPEIWGQAGRQEDSLQGLVAVGAAVVSHVAAPPVVRGAARAAAKNQDK